MPCTAYSSRSDLVARGYKTTPPGHLENDVSWQQSSISGNHSIAINMLDDDVDQRGLAAPHQPYGEAFAGIRSIDFDACNLTIWNQVKEPWED